MSLLLNRTTMTELLPMERALKAVEEAFAGLHRGTVSQPSRTIIVLPESQADCFFMPGYLPQSHSFGVKISPYFPANVEQRALPASIAIMVLIDDETGAPLAIMDADAITAVRTGATTALAAKYLARQHAGKVAVIGTGRQAGTQLKGICAVRDVQWIRAFSIDPMDRRRQFADRMSQELDVAVDAVESVRDAVTEADIVLLATTASEPVIEADWIAPGTHISSIQTTGPSNREVGTGIVSQSRIVCDSREACLAEAGELLIPIEEGKLSAEDLYADLGELVVGAKPGRQDDEEITFFKTVGLAIEDLAIARLAFDLAQQQGRGEEFDFLS